MNKSFLIIDNNEEIHYDLYGKIRFIKYFPKTNHIVRRFVGENYIKDDENEMYYRLVSTNPDLETMESGGIWWNILIDDKILAKYNNEYLIEKCKSLNDNIIHEEFICAISSENNIHNIIWFSDEKKRLYSQYVNYEYSNKE